MGLTETFGIEERWVRLLIKSIVNNPDLLVPERVSDAQYILGGIGNRQVYALRDWCRGIGIIEEAPQRSHFRLTAFGRVLLEYDPALDENGSWWAIHYGLYSNPSDIWFYSKYVNAFSAGRFSRGDLRERLRNAKPLAESVIDKKCITPLLHIMANTRLGTDFRILVQVTQDLFERQSPEPKLLHSAVVAFMLYDWAVRANRTTVNLMELHTDNSIGRCVGFEPTYFGSTIDNIEDRYAGRVLWVSHTAGLNSLGFANGIPPLALLRAYYIEHLEGQDPLSALETAIRIEEKAGEP